MRVTPLHDGFLFQFLNETTLNGMFVNKHSSLLIATPEIGNQMIARWGKVCAVGNKVEDFTVGDLVLIAPGKWTSGFKFDGERYWKSDAQNVVAVALDKNDESIAVTY